jgi:hypothetical protein
MVTLSPMLVRPRLLVAVLALAILALLGAAGPVWAHSGLPAQIVADPDAAQPGLALSAAPEAPGLPWPLLLAALAAMALGWRRPRRAVAFALVLLLAVFAYEGGLHSVHHGADVKQMARCPVGAAAVHLSATPVACVASVDVVPPIVAPAPRTNHAVLLARFLSPDQGRAPPSAV